MVIAPFIHIPVMYSDLNYIQILNYPFLSSFFETISWPITTLCAGLLFKYCLRYATDDGRYLFRFISHILLILGTYFLIYALIPMPSHKDLPVWAYYSVLGLVASLVGIMLYRLPDSNTKLKEMIRFLMNLIVVKSAEKDLIKDHEKWNDEIINVALKKLDE